MSVRFRWQVPKRTGWALVVAATAAFFSSCALQGTHSQPNIVFLFSDDHSVPDLGCYGNPTVQTPTLDRLAAEGIRFDRAYVSSPQCSPSRASVFTGRAAHDVHASRLHAAVPVEDANVVQLLKGAGYYTGAYRKVHQPNIQDEFDFYGGPEEPLSAFFENRPEERPFFLWFGSRDPHRAYGPGAFEPPHDPAAVTVPEFLPDTPEVRQDLAYYYDAIARFDRESGEILELLEGQGVSGTTMVVMAGDNGMPFPRAKATLYEPGIKVPLLVRWPGRTAPGQVSEELVSLMDLAATWLEAAGMDPPQVMRSRSLIPLLTGTGHSSRDYVFSERNWHDNWDPMRAVVGRRYKLIQNFRPEVPYRPSLDIVDSPSWTVLERLIDAGELQGNLRWYARPIRPRVELYDLDADPGEWRNLAADPEYRELVDRHQQALSDWIRETNDFLPPIKGAFPDEPRYQGLDPL
jgi:arylsulfatase A-like enzyme